MALHLWNIRDSKVRTEPNGVHSVLMGSALFDGQRGM